MLTALIESCLRLRLLVAGAAALLALAGWQAFRHLPIDAFPDVSTTQVKVILKAPGMTPEEIESRVVMPVEVELLGIPRQRILRSVSKYAIADVTVDFTDGTDVYWARQQVNERLANVLADLPAGVTGALAPVTTPLGEMFMFTIEGGDLSLEQRRTLLDWTIRPRLRTVPGVADVNTLGGHARAFEVVPSRAALAARGISPAQLEAALRHNNRNDGAGRLLDGEESLLVRAEGSIRTLEDVRAIVITERRDVPVRVGEVAEVRIGSLTRYGAVTRDGAGEAVQGLVLGLRGANARAVVDGVRQRLAELAPELPPGVRVEVFYDRSALVKAAVATVRDALFSGIALVVVVLVLFLGDWRASLVVSLALPLSALCAFIAMEQAGMSANLMSLGGLAIALGMLVDASIVVTENVMAHLEREGRRAPDAALVLRATREVAAPVAAAVLIIILVFLPLLSLEGLEGKLFRPVALAIVFALAASLAVALTVVPVAASVLARNRGRGEPWLVRRAAGLYGPALSAALAHPRAVAALALGAVAATAWAWQGLGSSFLPDLDEGDVVMQVEKLPSIGLPASLELDRRIESAILARVPEARTVVARTGADEIGLDPMGLNQSDVFVMLVPREQRPGVERLHVVEKLRAVMADFPGVRAVFTQPIEMRVAEMLTGVRGDVAVKVFGHDLSVLNALAHRIAEVLAGVPGGRDVFTVTNEGVAYLQVRVNRFATGHQKLTVDDIQDDLRSALEGRRVGTVVEGNRRTPLLLRGEDALRASAALFGNQNLVMPDGAAVPLGLVARLERTTGPVKVDRENGFRYAGVQAAVIDRDLVGFVDEARARVAQAVRLPEGYRLSWGGQFENQQRAAARLAVVVPIALAAIFLLLYGTFGVLRDALLIFANIPFALVGGVLALRLSGEYLSVPATIGFIALLGIAVENGVVLLSTFNGLRDSGLSLHEAVTRGAVRRLRPVLMTSATTAFGLLPLLAARGPGSEVQRPLAIVVTGGLVSATALTLFLLPLLYRRFARPAAAGIAA